MANILRFQNYKQPFIVCFAIATLQNVPQDEISWEICGSLILGFANDVELSKSFLQNGISVAVEFVCMSTTTDDRSDDDNRKLCSVSSNDADADDITPDNNCIDGASGSLSELSASVVCNFSVFHHGDWQPSDAVWYDDRDWGVIVYSDAVTNDSSSMDDFTLEFNSCNIKKKKFK